MIRPVLYMAHPLAPTEEQIAGIIQRGWTGERSEAVGATLRENIDRAMRWLAWLRRAFRETTFVAPWIASVLAGDDDRDPAQREAGIVDALAVIPRLDGLVFAGSRISGGMAREHTGSRRTWDLTWMGLVDPPVTMNTRGLPFDRMFGAHIYAPGPSAA